MRTVTARTLPPTGVLYKLKNVTTFPRAGELVWLTRGLSDPASVRTGVYRVNALTYRVYTADDEDVRRGLARVGALEGVVQVRATRLALSRDVPGDYVLTPGIGPTVTVPDYQLVRLNRATLDAWRDLRGLCAALTTLFGREL